MLKIQYLFEQNEGDCRRNCVSRAEPRFLTRSAVLNISSEG